MNTFNYSILFVAMSSSIHTARWINQINQQPWQLHCYPSTTDPYIHPELDRITLYCPHFNHSTQPHQNLNLKRDFIDILPFAKIYKKKLYNKIFPDYHLQKLHKVILEVKPDIIHSLEIQAAGYLVSSVKQKYFQNQEFPKWIVTNWGSDIYLYGKLKDHKEKIKKVLAECDYYSCECHRDIELAKQFGFQGKTLPVFPNAGGFDLEMITNYRQPGLTSERKVIMLKGYQTWAGRALCGLRALERCAELLTGYQIVLYSASDDVKLAAELFFVSTGIKTKILPTNTPHTEILKHHGQARISIGVSISDAISTSLLEAIVMGSFPIQSWTSCANEWITDGETGLLIPPEDPEIIEQAIRRALTDDQLVNSGVKKNLEMAKARLDSKIIQPMAVNFYKTVFNDL
jgi:glycosyltransferase involved in cell wall biosynthesis